MPADFTQGKWQVNAHAPEGFNHADKDNIISADGKYIASVQKEADARLISAAPDMYSLLCVLWHEGVIPTETAYGYRALRKTRSIVEQVTGDKIKLLDESSGVSP